MKTLLFRSGLLLSVLAGFSLTGCSMLGGGQGGSGGNNNQGGQSSTVSILVKHGTQTSPVLSVRNIAVGAADKDQIVSIKYAVEEIDLWSDHAPGQTGTALSGTGTRIRLFHNDRLVPGGAMENMTLADAATDDEDFVDLMDATDVQKLATPLTLDANAIGSYKLIEITCYPIVKITARVTLDDAGGTVLYTRAVDPSAVENTTNDFHTNLVDATDGILATQPASGLPEESIVPMKNETFFFLENPFTVTQNDIDSGSAFNVVMTFNPEGFLQASTMADDQGRAGNVGPFQIRDGTWGMLLPPLSFGVVAVKAGATLKRETYLITMTVPNPSAVDQYYLGRLQLYYDSSDTTKSISGLNMAMVPDFSSGHLTTNVVPSFTNWYIYGVTQAVDSTYSLNVWTGKPWFSGLTRGADGQVQYDVNATSDTAAQTDIKTFNVTYLGEDTVQ